MEIKTTLSKIASTLPKPPRRTRMSQFYSRTYYPLRCKTEFEPLWQHEQTRVLAPGEKRMRQLDLANKLAIEAYEKETQEFKDWLEGEREKEHQANIKAYKETMKALDVVPEDAPSYHRSVQAVHDEKQGLLIDLCVPNQGFGECGRIHATALRPNSKEIRSRRHNVGCSSYRERRDRDAKVSF